MSEKVFKEGDIVTHIAKGSNVMIEVTKDSTTDLFSGREINTGEHRRDWLMCSFEVKEKQISILDDDERISTQKYSDVIDVKHPAAMMIAVFDSDGNQVPHLKSYNNITKEAVQIVVENHKIIFEFVDGKRKVVTRTIHLPGSTIKFNQRFNKINREEDLQDSL